MMNPFRHEQCSHLALTPRLAAAPALVSPVAFRGSGGQGLGAAVSTDPLGASRASLLLRRGAARSSQRAEWPTSTPTLARGGSRGTRPPRSPERLTGSGRLGLVAAVSTDPLGA